MQSVPMPAVFLETAFCLPQPHYCHFKLRFHLISIGWGRAQLPALSADALPGTAGCSVQGSAAIHLQTPWLKVEERGTYTFPELSTLRKSSSLTEQQVKAVLDMTDHLGVAPHQILKVELTLGFADGWEPWYSLFVGLCE